MEQIISNGMGRLSCLFSSTVEWFTSLIEKCQCSEHGQQNTTQTKEAIPVSPQEIDVPEELICNRGDSRFKLDDYKPTIDVHFSIYRTQNHSIQSRVHNALLHDSKAPGTSSISVKGTPDVYVKKYMNNGIYEEELIDVLRTQLTHDFHGMILEDEVRNQTQNGSYLIRWFTGNTEIDHCTAMIIKLKDRIHFDPTGEPPLHLINFFTDYNKCQLQSSEYNTCAFHCAYYLIERHKGSTFDEFIASYPGNLEANDKMVTERFVKLHDESKRTVKSVK